MSEGSDFVIVSPKSKCKIHSTGISENVRVGPEYQAVIPDCVAKPSHEEEVLGESLMMWKPLTLSPVSEVKIEEYLRLATKDYHYSLEQAHGLLFWHKCNLEAAIQDMAKFTPVPSQWNSEERKMFSQSVKRNRKDKSPDLSEIQKDLPHKSVKSLVEYYYIWESECKKNLVRKKVDPTITERAHKRYWKDSPNVRNRVSRFKS